MAVCPNCGERVADRASVCDNCGASIPAGQEQQPGDGEPGTEPGQGAQRGDQPQRDRRESRDQPQGGQGQPGQGQPRGGQGQPGQGQPRSGQGLPGQGQPRGGQGQPGQGQSRGGQGQPGQGQPRGQGQPGQDRSGRGRRQQPPNQQRGQPQPAPGGPPGGRASGYDRRELLKYGGVAAVLLGGGYLGYQEFIAGGGPKSVVRQYFNAREDDDRETLQSLVAEGATASTTAPNADTIVISIDDMTTVQDPGEGDENVAVVRADLTVSYTDTRETEPTTVQVRLQKADGEWKVYSVS